jgi:hypothetical protein
MKMEEETARQALVERPILPPPCCWPKAENARRNAADSGDVRFFLPTGAPQFRDEPLFSVLSLDAERQLL